jgi:adenylosuccinate synthase
MMRHAVRLNSLSELAVGKIDKLDRFDVIKVCVAYEIDGRRVTDLPYHQSELHRAVPIYEELPGWKCDLTAAFEPHHLPKEAHDFIALLRRECGVPINLVAVGRARDQFVHFADSNA